MAESLATQSHKSLLERANRVPGLIDKAYSKIEQLKQVLYEVSPLNTSIPIQVIITFKPQSFEG